MAAFCRGRTRKLGIGHRVLIYLGTVVAVALALWLLWAQESGEDTEAPVAPVGTLERETTAERAPEDFPEGDRVEPAVQAPSTPPVMADDAALAGRVVDADGQGIPKARVAAYTPNYGAARTTTDGDGYFQFETLKPGPGGYRVSAEKEHFNEAVEEKVAAGRHDVELVLQPLSTALGAVVDAGTGRPIASFKVAALKTAPADPTHWRRLLLSAHTKWQTVQDAEGRFELPGVASRKAFAVAAQAEGYEPAYVPAEPIEPGAPGTPVVIRLSTEARVKGIVVSPSGAPVEGAAIHLGEDVGKDVLARSDGEGRFVLAGLGETRVVIGAAHPNFLPGYAEAFPSRTRLVEVRIVLGLGGRVEGHVTRGGRGQANQKVTVSRLTPPRFHKETVTDGTGHYAVEGVSPGEVEVMAKLAKTSEAERVHRLTARTRVKPGQAAVIDLAFPEAFSSLRGTISVNGEAPASAEIRGTVIGSSGDDFLSTDADEKGQYEVTGLAPGTAHISVDVVTQTGSARRRVFQLDIPEGANLHHDVALDGAHVVFGTVKGMGRGDAGEALAVAGKVSVDASDIQSLLALEESRAGSCELGAEGEFEIEGLPPGEYTLIAVVFPADADGGALAGLRAASTQIEVKKGEDLQADLGL